MKTTTKEYTKLSRMVPHNLRAAWCTKLPHTHGPRRGPNI